MKTIAEMMMELGGLTFEKCGMLEFTGNATGDVLEPTSIGPLSGLDMDAEADQIRLQQQQYEQKQPQQVTTSLQVDLDQLTPPKFREIGPFEDTKSYLLALLDFPSSPRLTRIYTTPNPSTMLPRILYNFISWIQSSIANAYSPRSPPTNTIVSY